MHYYYYYWPRTNSSELLTRILTILTNTRWWIDSFHRKHSHPLSFASPRLSPLPFTSANPHLLSFRFYIQLIWRNHNLGEVRPCAYHLRYRGTSISIGVRFAALYLPRQSIATRRDERLYR